MTYYCTMSSFSIQSKGPIWVQMHPSLTTDHSQSVGNRHILFQIFTVSVGHCDRVDIRDPRFRHNSKDPWGHRNHLGTPGGTTRLPEISDSVLRLPPICRSSRLGQFQGPSFSPQFKGLT